MWARSEIPGSQERERLARGRPQYSTSTPSVAPRAQTGKPRLAGGRKLPQRPEVGIWQSWDQNLIRDPSACSGSPSNHSSLGPRVSVVEEEAEGWASGAGEALTLVWFLELLPKMQSPGCSLHGHFSGLHLEGGTQRDLIACYKMGVPQAQWSSAVTQASRVHSSHLDPYRITQGLGGAKGAQ